MLHNDPVRRICLLLTATVFVAIAVRAVLVPEKMAAGLGYSLNGANGYSEFYAIYFGVRLATAILAALAALRVKDAILGDLTALFVLAQPVGRLIGLSKAGLPHGFLLVMFGVELAGGLVLFAVRPSA
jgi:hypothetical protein